MNSTVDLDDDAALPDSLREARYAACGIYEAPAWYDVDYAGYRGEEAFYRLVLAKYARPGGSVVELGAGTGRLTIPFAQEGFRMHGVEPAAPMRVLLEEKCAKAGIDSHRLTIEDADSMTFCGPPCRVDAVIFPFNGVLHVQNEDDLRRSFQRVHELLADDGRFALDCTGPYWDAMLYGPMSWGRSDERTHPRSGARVFTCDRSTYEPATRQMRIEIRYLEAGSEEGVQITLLQTMWTWQQVLSALDASGFVVELIFGGVDLAPFDEGSSRLLVSCRKKDAAPQ